MESVLISGASGLIGKPLSKRLTSDGYEVRMLSREKTSSYFYWNPTKNEIDEKAFENLDAIIHLAGAPISKKWTNSYKKELYKSRINTADLLFETAKKLNAPIKTFITASGVNYYGTETTDKIFDENDAHADDFLGNLCFDLEQTAKKFESLGARVCTVRTAAVLSTEGGMLKELMPLADKYLLSPLGSGKQILPWIHLDDLVNLYVYLLENKNLSGAYNAVATQIINNHNFSNALMKSLNKKMILPAIPGFVLKMVLGEMSTILLQGSAVSNSKIKKEGFAFQFEEIEAAFHDLFNKKTAEFSGLKF